MPWQYGSLGKDTGRDDTTPGRQREMNSRGRGRSVGRGGGHGWGRGGGYDAPGWRNASSLQGARPLPPPRNMEYTKNFIQVLVPLLQAPADTPVTLEGEDFDRLQRMNALSFFSILLLKGVTAIGLVINTHSRIGGRLPTRMRYSLQSTTLHASRMTPLQPNPPVRLCLM